MTSRWNFRLLSVAVMSSEVSLGHFIRCPVEAFELASFFSQPSIHSSVGNSPADRRTRHRRNNSRLHSSQKTLPAVLSLDNLRRIYKTLHTANLLILRQTSRLQQCLDHVERRGDRRSESTGQTTGDTVAERVVALRRVHDFGQRFVGHELCCCEGNCHTEGGRVGDVEGGETFVAVDMASAVGDGLVLRAVDLHALFDH